MKKKKTTWNGLGFPIVLVGFKAFEHDGEQIPDVNMNELQDVVFKKLILWPHRLTGSQFKFIRTYLGETQSELARNINVQQGSSLSQWEACRDNVIPADVNTEIVLRLYMAQKSNKPHRRNGGITDVSWLKIKTIVFGALEKLDKSTEPMLIQKRA